MIPSRFRILPFELLRPRDLSEVRPLYRSGDQWQFMAGGVDLKKQMKAGMAVPLVVDLKQLDALRGVSHLDGGDLRIGAAVTHAELAASPAVVKRLPDLPHIWRGLGNVRVRMVGTVGGNLVAAFPQYHVAPVLASLGAVLEVYDGEEVRRQPLAGTSLTSLRGKLVLGIRLDLDSPARTRLIRDFTPAVSVAASFDERAGDGNLCVAVVAGAGIARKTFPMPQEPAQVGDIAAALSGDVTAALGHDEAAPHGDDRYEPWVRSVLSARLQRFALTGRDRSRNHRGA